MTHRCIGSIALFIAMVILPAVRPAAWAEDKELSLGYLAVTEVEGGNLQVLARCVETRRVLEEIAKHTGASVVFDTPCNTYVSQLDPKRTTNPEKWMDFIASNGAELFCRKEEGAWHVRQQTNPPYDAGLQEDEVKNLFTTNVASSSPGAGGTATGLVFIRGKMIPPPYQVTHELDADGRTLEVKINGVPFKRVLPEPSSGVSRKPPAPPVDGQCTTLSQLTSYVIFNLYPRLLQSAKPEEARTQVMKFLATQKMVEKVELQTPGRGQIKVYIRYPSLKDAAPIGIFPSNYNLATGEVIDMVKRNNNVAPEEKAKQAEKEVMALLDTDTVLLYGRTAAVVFRHKEPLTSFAGALEKSRGLPLLQAECLFAEVVEDRVLARELAANLDDATFSNVQAILSRKKAAELTPSLNQNTRIQVEPLSK